MCFLGHVSQDQAEFPFSFYAYNDTWNRDLLEIHIPSVICDKIVYIKPPSEYDSKDFPSWRLNSDGEFSLKFVYHALCNRQNPISAQVPLFQKLWKWRGLNRIRSFLWNLVHGRLLTNEERLSKGMTSYSSCPRCNSCPESIMHLFRDCEEAKIFSSRVVSQDSCNKFFSQDLLPWLEWNLSSDGIGSVP